MKYKSLFSVIILCFVSPFILAQTNCNCCSEEYSKFDFWLGDWNVYDTTGTLVGENTIVKLEDNCIVNEHWKGKGGVTGRSYNYYNQSDSTWNQLWLDNKGSSLELKGTAEEDKMILKSKLIKGKKVAWYANKITWTKNEDNSVTQIWEIVDENDKVLSVAFVGIYRIKETLK